jgi:hypothetical protein
MPNLASLLCLIGGCLLLTPLVHAQISARVDVVEYLDADEDGLDDELEIQLGTDPENADSDQDGWADLAEVIHETDPNDSEDFPHNPTAVDAYSGARVPSPARLRAIELLHPAVSSMGARRPVVIGTSYNSYRSSSAFETGIAFEALCHDLKAGDYVFLYQQVNSGLGAVVSPAYEVLIRRHDGTLIARWDTPVPVDSAWRYVALPFTLSSQEEGQPVTVEVRLPIGSGRNYLMNAASILPAGLEVDMDRDGMITPGERPGKNSALRHWINDDVDQPGHDPRADLPGAAGPLANWRQPGVNGLRDLVDFIPLSLNLARLARILTPDKGFRYHLVQKDSAVRAVTTALTPASVGAIHRNPDLKVFGEDGDAGWESAQTLFPDAEGRLELPASFIDRLCATGHAVVLLEGAADSRAPLRLVITHEERDIVELAVPLAIAPVEAMYRHVDLTDAVRTYEGRAVDRKTIGRSTDLTEPPGLPDSATNGRTVIMVHGYNVAAAAARGWQAETFKRLRAMGCNAGFIGLTWDGDTGLDYHQAVFQAFQTGERWPQALGFLDASRTTIIAHSLGNIVACQAIQSGFTPAAYFMLNAALPIEAIAGERGRAGQSHQMTEALWRPYAPRLSAAEWSKLRFHSAGKTRLTWANCFSRVRLLGIATNCYSSGEDVTNCPVHLQTASVLAALWKGPSVDYGAWKTQELLKGVGWDRSLGALVMARTQGGWGFNQAWRERASASGPRHRVGGLGGRLDPATADRINDLQLIYTPYFRLFEERWLHSFNRLTPLNFPTKMRYDLLARGIPALSYAAGGVPIPGLEDIGRGRNFDLETQGRPSGTAWPTEGHEAPHLTGRWLHSDFKNVALPYVHPLFRTIVHGGGLR